jgi:hemoglobin/transferrin/lactoferrin receptor protein
MMRSLPSTCLLLALAAGVPLASAQDAAQDIEEPPTGSAEPAQIEEDEDEGRVFRDQIVVTASRQEEASANTPAPITVIDSLMIEQAQPEKMADLFKQIPGVEIAGEGPFRGIPVIRGFSSNRVLILVDGQRLNNARESTTFAGIQPGLVNLSEVERIEVLRGPASVQYGSDAIGGVINILTRRPELSAQEFTVNGDVAYDYGTSSDSQNARASVSGAGKGWGFTLGAAYQEAKDYTAADGASDDPRFSSGVLADDTVPNSGMEQSSFDGSLRFSTGDQGVFRVNVEAVRTDDVGFPGFDPETSGIDISFPNFDRDKLGLAWNSGPVWGLSDISLSTYYQKVDKESIRVFDFGPSFFQSNFTRSQIDSYGFNAQSIADAGRHHLTFGFDLYRDEVDDETLEENCFSGFCLPPSTNVAVPKSTQTGLGAYIQDQWSATDALTVHLGLRGDTFDFVSKDDPNYIGEPFDVTDGALSGNLGITYSVTDHVNLIGLVARGFRSPNLQERSFEGFASTGDTFIIQNPDLDSESSLNYEAGFKARYGRYFGGLTVFYNDLQDFISFEFIGEDPDTGLELAQFQNIDKATIWGIELDLETIFASWWSLFTNATYTEGDNDTTGEPLSAIPPLKVIVGLRYQRARWWSEASLRFVDAQDRLPTDDPRFEKGVPGFTVYDLRGGYDFGFGLGVLASLENLTDKLYAEPFNNRPEPGRNLRLGLRYRF